MTVSDLIAKSYLKSTGKVSTLTSTDSDWTKLLAISNLNKDAWVNEPNVDWESLYLPAVECGTVTNTDTFDLDSSIHTISKRDGDYIRIVHTDGKYTDYTLTEPQDLKYRTSGHFVAKIGSQIKFNHTFVSSDPQFGGTIQVPAYKTLPDLVNATDEVEVDDPNWLVVMNAAEYVSTNLVLQYRRPDLIAEANQLMQKMIESNDSQLDTIPHDPVAHGRHW